MKTILLAAAAAVALGTSAMAAEPIVGKWRAPGGGIVQVSDCGGAYCAEVISGQHKGKSVGRMSGSGAQYDGEVTDPRDDRTYSGRAVIQGDRLELTGCALKIFCKTQVWVKI
ncbi:DUF2147 domain-containing protein [Aurantimonas sp. A2-1-M11]|uniref:DUF2147 domain-containing protein n=1 Tax=Aurantimonas sp. A2-1-M11 TaxID=3113712 RepID=UPI002F93CD8F